MNISISKLNTNFAQFLPCTIFVNFCMKFKVNNHDFYDLKHLKKCSASTICNNM